MASENIFQAYMQPVRSVADYGADIDRRTLLATQVQGAQRQNALADLAAQEQAATISERSALQQAIQSKQYDPTNPAHAAPLIAMFPRTAPAMLTTVQGQQTSAAKAALDNAQAGEAGQKAATGAYELKVKKAEQAVRDIAGFQSPAEALASLEAHAQAGDIDPQKAAAVRASIPQDPALFSAWQVNMLRGIMSAKDRLESQKPLVNQFSTGGAHVTQLRDPVTGAAIGAPESVPMTVSPDTVANNKTSRANNADTIAGEDRRAGQAVTYQQDANGNIVALPSKVAPGGSVTATQVSAPGSSSPLQGKPTETVQKDILDINQQRAMINGALEAVKATPGAFSFARGLATKAGDVAESVAGRIDSDAERQARAFVYNNVSAVIKERAGTAQSKQEMARLRSFLPGETDNADQITSKLNGYLAYLKEKERGTTTTRSPKPAGGPTIPRIADDAEYSALASGATFISPDGQTRRKP